MSTSFFSTDVRSFFKSRSIEVLGLFLIAFAIGLGISFFFYDSADPSWNTASSFPPTNMMGSIGSYLADFFLQFFGFGSFILLPILFFWGTRLLWHKRLPYWPLKISGAMITLSCASILTPAIAFPDTWWPMLPRGGAIGIIGTNGLLALETFLSLPHWLSLFVISIITFILFTVSASIKWRTWGRIIQLIGKAIAWSYILISRLFKKTGETSGISEAEVRPAPRQKIAKKTVRTIKDPRPEAEAPSLETVKTRQDSNYHYPPLDLLSLPQNHDILRLSKAELQESGTMLSSVLDDFGVKGDITDISPGPVVTLYKLKPAPGTKSSRVVGLSEDIARSMSAISARIAIIPGYNALGIELPNPERQTVYLREQLSDKAYINTSAALPLILGKDIGGAPVIADLAKMPHLLVAGTTGSGKSVSINTMILSLLYHLPPERCRFIMIDPKMLELSVYDGIPHLLAPVVTDPHKAIMALKWVVREMENRYQNMSKLNVRNVDGYNQRIKEAKDKGEELSRQVQTGFNPETGAPIYETQALTLEALPYIVVIVDEMADLMLVAGKDIEGAVQRLAQMARAAGIHIIMATQRPSVDVITGTIKANFPTRISFQVTSKIDSRTILGEQGAEQLLGQGDMLYMAAGGRVTRIHGPFVNDREVEKIVKFLKTQGPPDYLEEVTSETGGDLDGSGTDNSNDDPLYQQALDLIARERKASTSFIQRHLKIGYNRAASIIDEMESQGVVSPANHVGKREVLLPERA